MFDYKLIEALAAIAEKGGFDKAAKSLHITQSAVSQRLKLLEDQMGSDSFGPCKSVIYFRRKNTPRLTCRRPGTNPEFIETGRCNWLYQ